ncbi:MAG: hypothetical protein P9L92_05685 [Candidatus Electryonea clarkiae]|nr:hypothetical protein [Candidatus Electryonea clarkiae]MDP8289323.1 hypothetical protein [Candidatus Electryonea clarkiae]
MNGSTDHSENASGMSKTECESNISALIDGELEPEALLITLDKLVDDNQCIEFYEDTRKMQQRLGAGDFPHSDSKLPQDLWNKIERKSGLNRPLIVKLFGKTSPVWAAAATIFFVFSLWAGGVLEFKIPQFGDRTISLTLGENEGKMDEERFVELTAELLKADKRYHRKMLDVMEAVDSRAFIQEGSLEESKPRLSQSVENRPKERRTPRTVGEASPFKIGLSMW